MLALSPQKVAIVLMLNNGTIASNSALVHAIAKVSLAVVFYRPALHPRMQRILCSPLKREILHITFLNNTEYTGTAEKCQNKNKCFPTKSRLLQKIRYAQFY